MATGNGVNQGKTAFLEEFLPENRDATLVEANRAWNAAGNEGTLSESLFGKIRSRLGLTGRRGADAGDAAPESKGKGRSPKGAKGKGTSRAVEVAPAQPNGREGDKGPSKSSFVEELLGREPGANLKKVNEVWASSGQEGEISPSIYYKIKRERGVTGETSPGELEPQASEVGAAVGMREDAPQAPDARPAATATAASADSPASGDLGRVVDEVEAGIDDLMFTLKSNGGMPEVEAALRAARRLLTRSNGA